MNGRYTHTLTTGLVHVQVPQLCRRLHLNRGLEIAFIFGILKSGSNNMLIIRPYQLKLCCSGQGRPIQILASMILKCSLRHLLCVCKHKPAMLSFGKMRLPNNYCAETVQRFLAGNERISCPGYACVCAFISCWLWYRLVPW